MEKTENLIATRLNQSAEEEARQGLLRCCGSQRWAEGMLQSRPFADDASVFEVAEAVWKDLSEEDWLEAFSHHPRIGERKLSTRAPAETRQWASQEQAGAARASAQTQEDLEEGNRIYEERFGHVFLICATGLSAPAMLASLRQRLGNDPETELGIAAGEQAKITRLRLQKWAGEK